MANLENLVLIDPEILSGISDMHEKVSAHAKYHEALREKETLSLYQESTVNSARLEQELMARHDEKNATRNLSKEKLEKKAKNIGIQVQNAWNYATANFKGKITQDLIVAMGNLIDPFANQEKTLRIVGKQGGGGGNTGKRSVPTPDKVAMYLPKLMEEWNEGYILHKKFDDASERTPITPVERAAYAHMMTFIMQPLYDGNKRTGRMLQNLILQSAHLPPAIIYGPENSEYMAKLTAAQDGYDNRGAGDCPGQLFSPEERNFFDFIGKRVLISLQRTDDILTGNVTPVFGADAKPDDKGLNQLPLFESEQKS
ncbi:MAG TPA: Fic family protein [Candidatus Nanoarchaeia archaeon]|nr:Fic family protein [Candidatus Nanoarchaeia archaeon]